jgi:hypothetical protein
MNGQEFLELCRRVRAVGKYVRRVDTPQPGVYVVRGRDVLLVAEMGDGKWQMANTKWQLARRSKRCCEDVAQLWFELMKGV